MEQSRAIELLKQELAEIPQLRALHHERDKQKFELWHGRVETIIKAALDADDLKNFKSHQPVHVKGWFEDAVYQQDYLKRLTDYETALKSIIQKYELLEFEQETVKNTVKSPIQLFDSMKFHPEVVKASRDLFNSGHYADAIFAAFKAVNNFTKKKAGLSFDGKDLMAKAFNENNPVIKLNNLSSQSERDEQEGFRFLFMGAMVGIRNPKAHDFIEMKDPCKTLEYLGFASLLLNKISFWKVD
jgi:uncharacterized protein (TIGR02391 family)